MTAFVLQMVGIMTITVVVMVVRGRRSRQRRAELRAGNRVSCRARLALGAARLVPGQLWMSPVQVLWEARDGSRIDLTGSEVLAVTAPGGTGIQAQEALLVRLRLADGTSARVQLHEDDATTLQGVLHDLAGAGPAATTLPPAPPRRPRWALVCLAGAGLWVGAWAWLVVGGHSVTATVTGGDGEGYCDVRWTDPDGSRHTGEVDCADEPAGTGRTVWVLGWPATGEPVDPGWTIGGVLVVGGLVAAPGGFRLAAPGIRRRTDAAQAGTAAPAAGDHPVLPELDPIDLHPAAGEQPAALMARLAPYARRQVPDGAWESARRPAGVRGPLRPLRVALTLRGPALLLALVLCAGCWWPYRWLVLENGPTGWATAVSTGEVSLSGPGPLPDDAAVRYRGAAGPAREADVATGRDLPEGIEVRVEYSSAHPEQVRIVGVDDALGQAAAIVTGGVLVGLLWGARRLRAILQHTRAVHLAQGEPPRPALGLLTADGDGSPLVVLCDPLVAPVELLAVPVDAPLPAGTAAAFATDLQLTVRGRMSPGELLVLETPGGAAGLFPTGPAVQPGRELLAAVLDSAGTLARLGNEGDGPPPAEERVD